jgi:hypothetical protein
MLTRTTRLKSLVEDRVHKVVYKISNLHVILVFSIFAM